MLGKPKFGEPCNGCGYCCTEEPCGLAKEFLLCTKGPCVALEYENGQARCGMVRDPLGYLWRAVHPGATESTESTGAVAAVNKTLGTQIATALGIGRGCDAD